VLRLSTVAKKVVGVFVRFSCAASVDKRICLPLSPLLNCYVQRFSFQK
jgi:hypothetical protein